MAKNEDRNYANEIVKAFDANGDLLSNEVEELLRVLKDIKAKNSIQSDVAKKTIDILTEISSQQSETIKLDNELKALQAAKATTVEGSAEWKKIEQLIRDNTANKTIATANETLHKNDAQDKNISNLKNTEKEITDAMKKLSIFSKADNERREELQKQLDLVKEQELEQKNEKRKAEGKATLTKEEQAFSDALQKMTDSISDYTKKLEQTVESIGNYKTAWDTRLLGTDKNHSSISDLVKNGVGVSPFIKQSAVMEKLNTAIDSGIAYNVEQRAFLDVLSDSIATTFEAFSEDLKDLIRVQQEDSTAYRLGMEASLNEYLNSMYEDTEYLNSVSKTVTSNLYEAEAILQDSATSAADASISLEYQAQKWLGSLYSVGMSSESIGSISSALGKIASGDVSATESGAGKLLVMAASNAGLDFASMLTDGLDGSEMNTLLGAMVQYLQQIAEDSAGNNVVQNQLAKLFDLNVSDIKAATNLKGYTNSIYSAAQGYNASSATAKLNQSMSSMASRYNMAGALSNLKSNFDYTLSEGIAANPVLYSLLTVGDLLDSVAGGINIPSVSVMGNQVDLETTVSNLLRSGALAGSAMSGIGAIISGLGQIASGNGSLMYNTFSANSSDSTALHQGVIKGYTQNEDAIVSSSYVGESSGDSYTEAADALAADTVAEEGSTVDEGEDMDFNDIYDQEQKIIDYLEQLTDGSGSLSLSVNIGGTFASNINNPYGL